MKQLFLSLITILIFSSVLNAREILVDATAKIFNGNINNAKKQALKNVVYKAVRKSVENIIDLKKINNNYGVIKNQIYKFSKEFVIDYNVISEENNNDQNFYKITVLAKINNQQIKEILKDLRIINDKKQKNRLLIIFFSEEPNALTPENQAVIVTTDSGHLQIKLLNKSTV